MTPQDLLALYEERINLHRFDAVAPLIAADAVFWFNDGSFVGTEAIRAAFERTWNSLADETYWLTDLARIAVGSPRPAVSVQLACCCGWSEGVWQRARHDRIERDGSWLEDCARALERDAGVAADRCIEDQASSIVPRTT